MNAPSLASRLHQVRDDLARARAAAGTTADVTLVAVSKRHPADAIRAAYELGQRDFGESYAQELREKATDLADLKDLRWHFVGALQRNKVKLLSGVHMIHSVDRIATARAIQTRLVDTDGSAAAPPGVLVQVNFDEPQKAGVRCDDLDPLVEALAALPGLRLRGLMTLPPRGEASTTRRFFHRLATLAEELRARHGLGPQFDQLSMGMSGDYREAIAEGATLVRVGTAIFGPRPTP